MTLMKVVAHQRLSQRKVRFSMLSPLYICRYCRHHMIETTTPAGEFCVECQNPACHWCVNLVEGLEVISSDEASFYIKPLVSEADWFFSEVLTELEAPSWLLGQSLIEQPARLESFMFALAA